jgi:pimeloyl-ACP methyl ester carboxylesterase
MKYVYLHGFASGPLSRKARRFADGFAAAGIEVAVPDLVEGDFEGSTITGQLAAIDRIVAGDPAVLIGSSLGGYLAALYAARHSQVERLVLLAPAFYFPERWPAVLGVHAEEEWRRTGKRAFYHYADGCVRELSWNFCEDAGRYEPAPDFRQPALVFHGTRDDVVPASYSQQFAATHPNVILHLMDSGHELTDVLDTIWSESVSFLGIPAGSTS